MQRAVGTGTLKVPNQSILNLLVPGHILSPACVHSSATLQARVQNWPLANWWLLLQLAEVCVCPWLAGHCLPGDRVPQPTPQDVNLEPCLLALVLSSCWRKALAKKAGPFGHITRLSVASMAVQLLPNWHTLSSHWVYADSCPQPHENYSCWLRCPRIYCDCPSPPAFSPRLAGSKLLHSYSTPLLKGSLPGPDALCYQNDTSALSLQIIQDPELMGCYSGLFFSRKYLWLSAL